MKDVSKYRKNRAEAAKYVTHGLLKMLSESMQMRAS
jgi:hypothetical protein